MSQVEMAGRTHFVLEIPRRAQIVHSEKARVEEHEIGLQAPRDKHTDIQTDRHTDRHTDRQTDTRTQKNSSISAHLRISS